MLLYFVFSTIYTLWPYYDRIKIDSKSGNKGGIKIDLVKVTRYGNHGWTLSDILFDLYNQWGSAVFVTLSIMSTQKFYDEYTGRREFLFSDECVTREIEHHVLAYWWCKKDLFWGYSSYRLMAGAFVKNAWEIITTDKTLRGKVEESCKVIDIYEQDAAGIRDRGAFDYYSGIRDCYKNTKADPYYANGKRSKTQTVSDTWKNNKIPIVRGARR